MCRIGLKFYLNFLSFFPHSLPKFLNISPKLFNKILFQFLSSVKLLFKSMNTHSASPVLQVIQVISLELLLYQKGSLYFSIAEAVFSHLCFTSSKIFCKCSYTHFNIFSMLNNLLFSLNRHMSPLIGCHDLRLQQTNCKHDVCLRLRNWHVSIKCSTNCPQ